MPKEIIDFIYYDSMNSKICTVIKKQKQFYNFPTIKSFLNNLCLKNGANYDGRKESFKYLIKIRKFVPIYVNRQMMFFPIGKDTWVNYFAIESIEYHEHTCSIYFKDQSSITSEHPKRIHNLQHYMFRFIWCIKRL